MPDWSADFALQNPVWLGTARHGPWPRVAEAAAREAFSWKTEAARLPDDAFTAVPARLKAALGRLIGVGAEEIVLGNSATYGLHILANGYPFRAGDEVLAVDGDFPAVVFPWLPLRKRGVTVRLLRPRGPALGPDDLAAALTPATRFVALSWVDPFTGHAIDVDALGALCREHAVHLILDGSQAIGARPFDAPASPADGFVSCGQKWLCGPYGTGFAWFRPALLDGLDYGQAYWAAMQAPGRHGSMRDYTLREGLGAAGLDLFATGNFMNFLPWAAAVEYLLDQGIERIAAHNDALVARLIDGLDERAYRLVSPAQGAARSTLAVLGHREAARNDAIFARFGEAGIAITKREGNLRISPHLFNNTAEIDRALDLLAAVA